MTGPVLRGVFTKSKGAHTHDTSPLDLGDLPRVTAKDITDMVRLLGRAGERDTGRKRRERAAGRFHQALDEARERRPQIRQWLRRLPLPVRHCWVRWYDRIEPKYGRHHLGRGAS